MKGIAVLGFLAPVIPALAASPAHGQGLEQTNAPIQIAAAPSIIVPGMAVTLRGTSLRIGARSSVKITVRPPTGAPSDMQAALDVTDSFSVTFTSTTAVGRYQVTATAPDGRGTGQTSFDVQTITQVAPDLAKAVKDLGTEVDKVVRKFVELVKAAPPSPPRTTVINKAAPIIDGLSPKNANLDKALRDLDNTVERWARANPMLEQYYAATLDLTARSRGAEADLERALMGLSPANNLCDSLDEANRILSLLGLATDVWGKPLEIPTNIYVDRFFLDMAAPDMSAEQKFAYTEAIKSNVAAVRRSLAAWSTVATLIVDIAAYFANEAFSSYCVQYKGSFLALYTQELYQGNIKFWAYTEKLEGTLTLRYQRGSGQSAIPVTGEFAGRPTKFTLAENLVALDRKIETYIVARKTLPPILSAALPPPSLEPVLGPGAFSVPVTGVISGNGLLVKVPETATSDFNFTGKVFYVLVTPGMLVRVMWASLPYRNAAFILSRGTRGSASFTINSDANVSRIARTFTREEQGATFKVKFTIDVKACNPRCP